MNTLLKGARKKLVYMSKTTVRKLRKKPEIRIIDSGEKYSDVKIYFNRGHMSGINDKVLPLFNRTTKEEIKGPLVRGPSYTYVNCVEKSLALGLIRDIQADF